MESDSLVHCSHLLVVARCGSQGTAVKAPVDEFFVDTWSSWSSTTQKGSSWPSGQRGSVGKKPPVPSKASGSARSERGAHRPGAPVPLLCLCRCGSCPDRRVVGPSLSPWSCCAHGAGGGSGLRSGAEAMVLGWLTFQVPLHTPGPRDVNLKLPSRRVPLGGRSLCKSLPL